MEFIELTSNDEITDFKSYIKQYPEAVSKVHTVQNKTHYVLKTEQVIMLPQESKYDKLIFGKDQTEEIVNISYQFGNISIYFKNGATKVVPYKPYCLSAMSTKSGKQLLGSQYYKYITHLDDVTYSQMKDSWDRQFWFPRSIEEGFMMLNGFTYFKNLKVNDISYLSFDIENQNEHEVKRDELVVLITNTFRNNKGEYLRKVFSIKEYKSSIKMVNAWCDWVREINPDVMVGHNVFAHDLRILNLVSTLHLGRDGSPIKFDDKASKFRKDGQQQYEYFNARIHGREVIDSLWMSIKYDIGRKFPSYGLKVIEKHLGLVDKDRIEWDFTKHPVRDVIKDDSLWADFTKYAETDADSPIKMIDIMLPTLFYFNQSVPKTLQQMVNEATGSQLDSIMIRSYLQDGYSQPKTSNKVPFEGAVSIGIPGVYEHVKKIDVASLYPSIMLQYNIYDKRKDKDQHLLYILKYFREERLKNKAISEETGDKYYDDLQNTQKIAINSLYGFLGAGYLLYNFPEGAAAVTRNGREILIKTTVWATGHTLTRDIKHISNAGSDDEETEYEWVLGEKIAEGKGYTLVNGDTDSIAYTNNKPFTAEQYNEEIKEINSLLPEYIKFTNDGSFDKIIVIRAKNYIMLPSDPKKKAKNLKQLGTEYSIKGSSIMDQKKEKALKEFIQTLISCLVYDKQQELISVYNKYVIESQRIDDISRWATKKTVTDAVLTGTRKNETKVMDAIAGEKVQEGDKIYIFSKIEGEIPKIVKGEAQYYKDGTPVLVPNKILKLTKNWVKGEEDKGHYLMRVYDTMLILENVLDKKQFIDYTLKRNTPLLNELLQ